MTVADRRRRVIEAGYTGDVAAANAALTDPDPEIRAVALGALARLDRLDDGDLTLGLVDPDPAVRRRAVELAAMRPAVSLLGALHDDDPTVVEVAAWACGEQEDVGDDTLDRIVELATEHPEALVREAAVAALGAIGDERGLTAVLAGCRDVAPIRRRAVLALAPFDGDEVDAAIDAALTDRDWQVRQSAEDLRRIDPRAR